MSNQTVTPSYVNVGSGGIGCFSLLTIIFIVLKLVGIAPFATWSWWLVFAPTIVGFVLTLAIFLVAIIIIMIVAILDD